VNQNWILWRSEVGVGCLNCVMQHMTCLLCRIGLMEFRSSYYFSINGHTFRSRMISNCCLAVPPTGFEVVVLAMDNKMEGHFRILNLS
jgi:hypothetical protein